VLNETATTAVASEAGGHWGLVHAGVKHNSDYERPRSPWPPDIPAKVSFPTRTPAHPAVQSRVAGQGSGLGRGRLSPEPHGPFGMALAGGCVARVLTVARWPEQGERGRP